MPRQVSTSTQVASLRPRYVNEQLAYYRARAAAGDNSANWAILGLSISAPIAEKKLSRDLEHDADITGMMLMARTGYHPDNVFALHHLLRAATGDQSKFAAFFSTHPRWVTRDQRDDKAYSEALADYNRLWPDPTHSPGGLPPEVAFIGTPSSNEDKKSRAANISVPVYCRNTTAPVSVVLFFSKDGHPVHTEEKEFQDTKGNLLIRLQLQCVDKVEATPLTAAIHEGIVAQADRKMKAQAFVIGSAGRELDRSNEFEVHIPKN